MWGFFVDKRFKTEYIHKNFIYEYNNYWNRICWPR